MIPFSVSSSSVTGRKFLRRWSDSFPWLQYSERLEKAFCTICSKCYMELKVKLPTSGVTDQNAYTAFVKEGFSNWKKGIERFKSHEQSSVHRHACSSVTFHQSKNVSVMLSNQHTQARIDARFCLTKIFETIKFLAMQALALRGHTEVHSNFIQLLRLRATDCPKLKCWLESSKKYKWTSHDIMNEMLAIMSQQVQRQILSEILKQPFYAIMSDETTDISRKEQMSTNFRYVDESLHIYETFLGFYDIPSTDADTLFTVIKDVLLRFELPINKCRGQCYDGASSVSGSITGLQTRLREIEPRAWFTHCAGHNFSLVSQDAMTQIPEIADFLSIMRELITFVRASAKRLNIFKDIQDEENDEDDDESDEIDKPTKIKVSLKSFCPTRWCARVKALKSIRENYRTILEFCERVGLESGEPGVKARGFSKYLRQFESLILLNISITALERVESFNETIQATSINFKSILRRVDILKSSLNSLRSAEKFDDIFKETETVADVCGMDAPVLPRKRVPPKRLDSNTSNAYFPDTPNEKYRRIYFAVLDQILVSLDTRFDSETYEKLSEMEEFAKNVCDIEKIRRYLCHNGDCDFDLDRLCLHRRMFFDIDLVKEKPFQNLSEIQIFLQNQKDIREFCSEYTKFIRLLLNYPQTVCVAERSFSALKRLKTFLRANLGQKKLNDLAILHIHRDITDTIDMDSVIDNFIFAGGATRSNVFALKSESL